MIPGMDELACDHCRDDGVYGQHGGDELRVRKRERDVLDLHQICLFFCQDDRNVGNKERILGGAPRKASKQCVLDTGALKIG